MTVAVHTVIMRADETVHGSPRSQGQRFLQGEVLQLEGLFTLRLPSRDRPVPTAFSQASAELRSEKGTDARSPQKSSAMPTKHAKVRGQDSCDPRQSQGLAVRARCPLSRPSEMFTTSVVTQAAGAWPSALH